MAIEGLLRLFKNETHKTHIQNFKGKYAAVDAMSWLYKACYSCAYEIHQGIPTQNHIYYFMKMIRLL